MLREGHGMLRGQDALGSLSDRTHWVLCRTFIHFLGFRETPGFLSNYPLPWHFLGLYLCPPPSNPFPRSSRVLCPYPVQSFPFLVTILASTTCALSETNPPSLFSPSTVHMAEQLLSGVTEKYLSCRLRCQE